MPRQPKKERWFFSVRHDDAQNALEDLTNEELGEAFRAAVNYSINGEVQKEWDSRIAKMFFRQLAKNIDACENSHALQTTGRIIGALVTNYGISLVRRGLVIKGTPEQQQATEAFEQWIKEDESRTEKPLANLIDEYENSTLRYGQASLSDARHAIISYRQDLDLDLEKENLNDRQTDSGSPSVRPSVEEVKTFCDENGIKCIYPAEWHARMTAAGWKTKAGTPLKNWRAALLAIQRNESKPIPAAQYNQREYDNSAGMDELDRQMSEWMQNQQ